VTASFSELQRIAQVEFGDLVTDVLSVGEKTRLFLTDSSYIDLWLSRRLPDRFGFHWERRHLDDTFFRYDNFPDVIWKQVSSFPRHFHNGSQNVVEEATFSCDLPEGFRDFMNFVRKKMGDSGQ
jgi:hypothetical protein